MESKAYNRHDISDDTWHILEPVLPGRKGCWGRVAQDNRRFINAIADSLVGEIKGFGNVFWRI